MTECISCSSARIVNIGAKCSDMCSVTYKEVEIDGYVPRDMNIGGGDYVEFSFCLNCGQIQDDFPVENTGIEERESGGIDEDEDEDEREDRLETAATKIQYAHEDANEPAVMPRLCKR